MAIVYYSEKLKLAFRFQSSLFPNNIQLEPKSAGTVGVVAVCSHSFVPLVLIFMETRGKIFTLLASRVGFLNLVRKLGVKKQSSRRALVVYSSCQFVRLQRRLDYTAGVRERTNRKGFVREVNVD